MMGRMALQPMSGEEATGLYTLLRTDQGKRVAFPVFTDPGAAAGRSTLVDSRLEAAASAWRCGGQKQLKAVSHCCRRRGTADETFRLAA